MAVSFVEEESFALRKWHGRGIYLWSNWTTGNIRGLKCHPSRHKLLASSSIPCSSASDTLNMVDVVIGPSARYLVSVRNI
jgi:hypothetical protein